MSLSAYSSMPQRSGPASIIVPHQYDVGTPIQNFPAMPQQRIDSSPYREMIGDGPWGHINSTPPKPPVHELYSYSDPQDTWQRNLTPAEMYNDYNFRCMPLVVAREGKCLAATNSLSKINGKGVISDVVAVPIFNMYMAIKDEDYLDKTAEDVLSDFFIDGACTSDNGKLISDSNRVQMSRTIAVCGFGRSQVFNTWGDVRKGDKLGFILKRMRLPKGDDTMFVYNSSGKRMQRVPKPASYPPEIDYEPFQLIPFHGPKTPNLVHLEYKMPLSKVTRYGLYVHFGTSDDYAIHTSRLKYQAMGNHPAAYSIESLIKCRSISVIVNPKVYYD